MCPGRTLQRMGHMWELQPWVTFGVSLWLSCKMGKLKVDLYILDVFQEHVQQRP